MKFVDRKLDVQKYIFQQSEISLRQSSLHYILCQNKETTLQTSKLLHVKL